MTRSRLLAVAALASTATSALLAGAPPALADDAPPPFDSTTPPPAPTQNGGSQAEVPDGTRSAVSDSEALAASAADCANLKYCSWTGGYYTGPAANWTHGYSYNWGNYAVSSCERSGTSGAIWKNCASSLRNRNSAFTAYYFAQPNATGYHMTESPFDTHAQLGVFNNNIDSSVSR